MTAGMISARPGNVMFCLENWNTSEHLRGLKGFDSRWGHWDFELTSFRQLSGPRVDSSSESNEYQGYLLGVKAAGAQG